MTISPRSPRAARALGLVVLLVAFAMGAVAATAVDRVLHAEQVPRAGVAEKKCERDRPRLLDQVGLSDEQRDTIGQILERRRAQTDRFWSEAGPQLRAIMEATRGEIREVLTAEQRDAYDRLRRERKAEQAARKERKEAAPTR